MAYRLLAIDLDGTSVTDGRPPAPAVVDAVAAAEAHGVHVVIATGRPYHSAIAFSESFGLRNPAVCYQGALVKEIGNGRETLLAETMPRAPLEELLSLADRRGLEMVLYTETAMFISRLRHSLDYYDVWFGHVPEVTGTLAESLKLVDERGLTPLKCMMVDEPANCDRLCPELGEHFTGRLSVVRSHPHFVEATSLVASKGKGLARIAEYYGVSREETIAAGDSGNDISMIEWAGLGVAMGNATSDVLAVADWVAPTVYENGLVALIERHVLGNGRA